MQKKKITLIISLLLIVFIIIGSINKEKPENVILDEVKLISNDNIINRKSFAILVEGDNGDYTDYEGETWPDYSKYRFNPEESKCTDSEGNEDKEASLSYDKETESVTVSSNKTVFCKIYFRKKDTTIPSIKTFYVGSHNGEEYTTTENVNYHIEWNDNDVTEYCITEDSNSSKCVWTPVSSSQNHIVDQSVTLSDEKEYTFRAYVRDLDENESQAVTDTITLDKTTPTVSTFNIKNDAKYTNTQENDVTGTWQDKDVTQYCLKENSTIPTVTDVCWKSVSPAGAQALTNIKISFSNTTNETKTVYLWIKDGAGHISNSKSDTITLDTIAPTVTLNPSATNIKEETFTVTGTINETNEVAQICYKKNTEEYKCETQTTNSFSKTFSSLSAGTSYTIYVYAKDAAGNSGSAVNKSYKTADPKLGGEYIESKKPSGMITKPSGVTSWGDLEYRFVGQTVNNYICFGQNIVSSTKKCTEDHLYRIIGITTSGRLKIMKNSSLGTTQKWHSSDEYTEYAKENYGIKVSQLSIDLNDSLFLTNEQYIPSGWGSKIVSKTWNIGKVPCEDCGKNGYIVLNYEDNLASNSVKIGIMNLSDYYFAEDGTGSKNCFYNSSCGNSWMHINNNGVASDSSIEEWTIAVFKEEDDSVEVWFITSSGSTGIAYVTGRRAVRPVFYLTSDVSISGGDGSKNSPFVVLP